MSVGPLAFLPVIGCDEGGFYSTGATSGLNGRTCRSDKRVINVWESYRLRFFGLLAGWSHTLTGLQRLWSAA
jgi:carboxylesterase type B